MLIWKYLFIGLFTKTNLFEKYPKLSELELDF